MPTYLCVEWMILPVDIVQICPDLALAGGDLFGTFEIIESDSKIYHTRGHNMV